MINGLGERLQEQRTTHKLSQREVALALNVSMLTDKQKNLLKLFLEEL